MKLKDLSGILPVAGISSGEMDVAGISADSRKVSPGTLFVAMSGSKADGAAFAEDAVRRGALAVVAARGAVGAKLGAPLIEVDDPRLALARAAALFYGRQPATMVAVTCTSG